MVDALVESQPSVEKILKFSDMFLKLKDLTTSQAFQVWLPVIWQDLYFICLAARGITATNID